MPRTRLRSLLCAALLGLACASPPPPPAPPPPVSAIDDAVYLRAEAERARLLERQVERLEADLAEAEAAIVAVESGLLGHKTRADAVSGTAEARVQLERARTAGPWDVERLEEADRKLEEAERQIESGYFGAAIFFASRAERVARQVVEEALSASADSGSHLVQADRVNLREGPSRDHQVLGVLVRGTPVVEERTADDWMLVRTTHGYVGWVHTSLLR